jgi:predicted protein tyrosine phosphatase
MTLSRYLILNRYEAEAYIGDEPYLMVSITDPVPHGEPAKLQDDPNRVGLVRVEFHDIQEPTDGAALMTELHARAIWQAVQAATCELVVVHCEAGVSRSVSVAYAIDDEFDVSMRPQIWNEADYVPPPNRWVYDVMKRVNHGRPNEP